MWRLAWQRSQVRGPTPHFPSFILSPYVLNVALLFAGPDEGRATAGSGGNAAGRVNLCFMIVLLDRTDADIIDIDGKTVRRAGTWSLSLATFFFGRFWNSQESATPSVPACLDVYLASAVALPQWLSSQHHERFVLFLLFRFSQDLMHYRHPRLNSFPTTLATIGAKHCDVLEGHSQATRFRPVLSWQHQSIFTSCRSHIRFHPPFDTGTLATVPREADRDGILEALSNFPHTPKPRTPFYWQRELRPKQALLRSARRETWGFFAVTGLIVKLSGLSTLSAWETTGGFQHFWPFWLLDIDQYIFHKFSKSRVQISKAVILNLELELRPHFYKSLADLNFVLPFVSSFQSHAALKAISKVCCL